MCGSETGVAFAGEKWAFWVRFSVAEVIVVSCWSASVVAEVSLVSTSSRHSCLCAKKFALLGPMVGASAKKFALRAKNGQKLAVYGVLGELFRGRAAGCGVLGEFFRGLSGGVGVPGEFCRTYRHAVSFSGTFGALVTGCARSYPLRNGLQAGVGGGFALHEALWLRVAGVSEPHVVQFPRLVSECEGCNDQSADRRGEKRGRWAASGEVVCVLGAPASVVACCSHVNPLLRAVTRYVARKPAILSVSGAAQVRISGPTCALAGPSGHLWDRFATWCQSASGVPSTAF